MDVERKVVVDLLNSRHCKTVMQERFMRISKNSEVSEIVRKEGNNMFLSGNHNAQLHEQVWKFYSISIAAAEKRSEALAMAYGNRSALLIHLSKYEACITDIDRALNITNNTGYKVKLLCRKVKCLSALGSCNSKKMFEEAESMFNKITDSTNKKLLEDHIKKAKFSLGKRKFVDKEKKSYLLETLYENHTINDFSFIDIQYNDQYGRHLVATRDIKPGEVIFIEKPYTKFLNIKKLHAYCSHCFATTWANIPCDHCSWTMFCSEECKQDAWEKYHDLECPVYGCSKSENNDHFKQLAVRTLILGIKEAGSIENLKTELQVFDECTDITKGFVKDGKIQSIGFKAIYALAKEVSFAALSKHTDNTIMVLRSLARNTSFFGDHFKSESCKSYKKNETALFLGSLLLRLSKISELNSHQVCITISNHFWEPCFRKFKKKVFC